MCCDLSGYVSSQLLIIICSFNISPISCSRSLGKLFAVSLYPSCLNMSCEWKFHKPIFSLYVSQISTLLNFKHKYPFCSHFFFSAHMSRPWYSQPLLEKPVCVAWSILFICKEIVQDSLPHWRADIA